MKYQRRRAKLVSDKKQYKKKKDYDRVASQLYRSRLTKEAKVKYNESARKRMQNLRERRRSMPKPVLSDRELDAKRTKWRNNKRAQRKKETPEQKSAKAKRLLIRKIWDLSPAEFASIVQAATPTKKAEMTLRGFVTSPKAIRKTRVQKHMAEDLRKQLRSLSVNKDKDSITKKKVLTAHLAKSAMQSSIRNELGVKWETWKKYSSIEEEDSTIQSLGRRENRSDAFSPENLEEIESFYKEKSTALPLKRYVNKSVLTDSTKTVHKEFISQKKFPVSLSHFRKLRPKCVFTADRNKFNSCICDYCLNIDYKVIMIKP